MSLFAYYLDQLQSTPDGEGYAARSRHAHLRQRHEQQQPARPAQAADPPGRRRGRDYIKGGRHLRFADGTPLTNLYLTMLNKVGVPVEQIGDSNGQIRELSEIS